MVQDICAVPGKVAKVITVKRVKRSLKHRQNKDLNQTNESLMEAESIAECLHSAIFLTCIQR